MQATVDKDAHGYYRFDNKGKIGAAALYYLASSLGYKVSINTRQDKLEVYRLTCTKNKQRRQENKVKKIVSLGNTEQYVYDLETDNHHFSAGIGKLIVHNTDSNYICFPHLKTAEETWDYAEKVASEVTKLFPQPIVLEFENALYDFFFILTKKRYMYRECERDGIVSDEIGKKGVLLARRDNSNFVRTVYESVITQISNDVPRDDILYYVIQQIHLLFASFFPIDDFIITKSVGEVGNIIPELTENEKGQPRVKIGDYSLPVLPSERALWEDKLTHKGIEIRECPHNCNLDLSQGGMCQICRSLTQDFYRLALPPQVQLGERIKQRGQRVDSGQRLEYVVTGINSHAAKQYEKIECVEYFKKHSRFLTIDHFYYLKILSTSLDQMLDTAFGNEQDFQKGFVLEQYKRRLKCGIPLIQELKDLCQPKITLEFKE